jgi:hypothetical protein
MQPLNKNNRLDDGTVKTIRLCTALTLATAFAVSGCAQQAGSVAPSYVSQNVYAGRSCSQLMTERNDIVRQVNTLTSDQNKSATTDAVTVGVALLVFWPAAIALAATDDKAQELSVAKGNYEAITGQMRAKGCTVPEDSLPQAPAKTPKEAPKPAPADCPTDVYRQGCPNPYT